MSLTTISLALAVMAVVLNLWVLYRRHCDVQALDGLGPWCENWKNEAALNAFRKFLRIKVLSGGYGKRNAYYVTKDGALLAVDAVDFYLAHFAGMNNFWDLVADDVSGGRCRAEVLVKQIDFSDGERDFTYVDDGRICAFVEGIVPSSLIDSNYCTRATVTDFSNAIVYAQAEARKRNDRRYVNVFHAGEEG